MALLYLRHNTLSFCQNALFSCRAWIDPFCTENSSIIWLKKWAELRASIYILFDFRQKVSCAQRTRKYVYRANSWQYTSFLMRAQSLSPVLRNGGKKLYSFIRTDSQWISCAKASILLFDLLNAELTTIVFQVMDQQDFHVVSWIISCKVWFTWATNFMMIVMLFQKSVWRVRLH